MTVPVWEIRVGDVLNRLREMPDESVHCVVTSPPYWGLRDYGTAEWDASGNPECDHVAKNARNDVTPERLAERAAQYGTGQGAGSAVSTIQYRDVCGRCGARRIDQQLGLEATPEAYVARMVEVFREIRRVLRSDGVCFVNMGDGYAANGNGGGSVFDNGRTDGRVSYEADKARGRETKLARVPAGLKPKDLIGMPWRLAFALQADGWWLRSEIIWAKPNPMPESVTDRPTKAHEYIFLLTRAERYYYDADAIREPLVLPPHAPGNKPAFGEVQRNDVSPYRMNAIWGNSAGRNARSVWTIATEPFPLAHFATFPTELPRRCILAGTTARGVCPACGAPWRRVVERTPYTPPVVEVGVRNVDVSRGYKVRKLSGAEYNAQVSSTTTGWEPTCGHDGEPVPATVLDPFVGSGTTVMVAVALGRSGIGIELNPMYADMARRRVLADHGAVAPMNGATPAGIRGVQGRLSL